MQNKIPRFRIYAISFIVWLLLVIAGNAIAMNIFLSNSKDQIIDFINTKIPVKLEVGDIKPSFFLNFDFYNVTISTKDNDNEFLLIGKIKLYLNPIRFLSKKDLSRIITDININDAIFYSKYFDISALKKSDNSIKIDDDILQSTQKALSLLEYKEINIRNFTAKFDKDTDEQLNISLYNLSAYFTEGKYLLSSVINLPDNTTLTLNLDSPRIIDNTTNTNIIKNINKAYITLQAYDTNNQLFDYDGDISLTDSNFNFSLYEENDKQVLDVFYRLEEAKTYFELNDFNISKKSMSKALRIVNDAKVEGISTTETASFLSKNNRELTDAIDNIDGFISATLNVKGYYKKNEPLYVDMLASAKAEDIIMDVGLKLTNNILMSDNIHMNIKQAYINGSLFIPISNVYESKASISISNFNIADKPSFLEIDLESIFDRKEKSLSRIKIKNIRYDNYNIENQSYDIFFNKINKSAYIKDTYALDEMFAFNLYFRTDSKVLLKGEGFLPVGFINKIADKNIIDPLVLVHADYTVSNINKKLNHNLNIAFENMVTLEKIFEANATIEDEKLLLNNLSYKLDENNNINGKGSISRVSSDIWNLAMSIDTPIGLYEPRGEIVRDNNKTLVNLSTLNNTIKANGVVKDDGFIDFKIRTEKDISFQDMEIGANINVLKETNKNNIDINGNLDIRLANDMLEFNATTGFMLSNNNVIMLTNIKYENRGYILNGSGIIDTSQGVNKINFVLQEPSNGEGVIYSDISINKDNILAMLNINKIPLSSIFVGLNADGDLYTKATIIGSMKKPSVYVEEFSLKDFDFSAYRFDVSLKGFYRDEELSLEDVFINKIGENNIYLTKEESIKISKAFFSKEEQYASITVRNLFLLSRWNGKIEYNMEHDNFNNKVYTLEGKSIKINKDKIPNFFTRAIDDGKKISFEHKGGHGLKGNILRAGGSYIFNTWYMYQNSEFLNGYGELRGENLNMFLVSDTLGLEIFEVFNVIFKEIETDKGTYFTVGDKQYTLYSHITGALSSLMVKGRFVGKGKVQSQYFKRLFDDSTVDFIFDGNVLRIAELSLLTKSDKSGVIMTGSSDFLNNILDNMDFNLFSVSDGFDIFLLPDRGSGFLDSDADFGLFRTRGLAKLNLFFTGSIPKPEISGDVYLEKNDVQFTVSPNQKIYQSYIYGAYHYLYWDLRVHDVSRVQVNHNLLGDIYLEDGSMLSVNNNMANGMELEGTIDLVRGNIYYIQNIYQIEDGSIEFTKDNSLDPLVNLRSFTRRRYVSGDIPYDVTLYMEIVNARISSLLGTVAQSISPVRFYTIPALSTYEVYQLAGIPASSMEQIDIITSKTVFEDSHDSDQIRGVFSSYSDLMLRNFVLRPVERWFRQFFGIDYVGVNTEILDSLFFEEKESGENFNVNDYFEGTSVSFGKYVTRDLFLKYEVTYEGTNSMATIGNINQQAYHFNQRFGFEVNLLPDFKLANLVFEYNIHPFEVQKEQEFNIKTRWRF